MEKPQYCMLQLTKSHNYRYVRVTERYAELIPLVGHLKARERRIEKTDTQTDTQDHYCNPLVHAHRGLIRYTYFWGLKDKNSLDSASWFTNAQCS